MFTNKKKWVLRVLLVAILVQPGTQALGQSTGSMCSHGPFEKDVVDNNEPVYLQFCGPAPIDCFQVAAPTVRRGPNDEWVTSQGLVLEAQSEDTYDASRWQAYDPNMQLVWDHFSFEAIGNGTVALGAPGLARATPYRFRVAFRHGTTQKWSCWSELSSVEPTGLTFNNQGPNLPSDLQVFVEDDFRRPATTQATQSTTSGGDGPGPRAVWKDMFGPFTQSNINGTEPDFLEDALLNQADLTFITYEGMTSPDSTSYAEAKFKTVLPLQMSSVEDAFNFSVMARYEQAGAVTKFYQAKAFWGYFNVCAPTLFIFNASETSDVPNPGESQNSDPPPANCSTCATLLPSGSTVQCLQLPQGVVGPDFETEDVWLRIEVRDNGPSGEPRINATLSTCAVGGSATSCQTFMSDERLDTADNAGMAGIQGRWAIETHDERYLIDIFRAGSAQSP